MSGKMMSQDNPDYKKLFQEAIFHLRCLSGSRNSFTMEAANKLFTGEKLVNLRSPAVEKMHREAHLFLKEHEVPEPEDTYV